MTRSLVYVFVAVVLLAALAARSCREPIPPDSPASLRAMRRNVDALLKRHRERYGDKPPSEWHPDDREVYRVARANDAWLRRRGY
jgi:hypothetical protein